MPCTKEVYGEKSLDFFAIIKRLHFVDTWTLYYYNISMNKQSFLTLNNKKYRIIYDFDSNNWYYSCHDLINILLNSKTPRKYLDAFKRRNKEINKYVKTFKLLAVDNKHRLTDCINDYGLKLLLRTIKSTKYPLITKWLTNFDLSIDQQSRIKAYELWNSSILDDIEVGTTIALQQIHAYLFGGLYEFAGIIRDRNIMKDDFKFSPYQHFKFILPNIDQMPESTLEEIVEKYACMNIAHPFMEGNGRSTRIWLDLILKKNLKKCVDWSKIDKKQYLNAMKKSHEDNTMLYNLLSKSLTSKINDRQVFMKGIDQSYYYEGLDK